MLCVPTILNALREEGKYFGGACVGLAKT